MSDRDQKSSHRGGEKLFSLWQKHQRMAPVNLLLFDFAWWFQMVMLRAEEEVSPSCTLGSKAGKTKMHFYT